MNETMKALEEKSIARDVSRGPTKSPDKVRVEPLSKLGSPSSIVQLPKSDPINYLTVNKEELFSKVEELLKSDDEETSQADKDTRDGDRINNTVDEASNVDNWHTDIDSELNKLNNSIENLLEIDESGVKRNTTWKLMTTWRKLPKEEM